jgi:hypothetical protein
MPAGTNPGRPGLGFLHARASVCISPNRGDGTVARALSNGDGERTPGQGPATGMGEHNDIGDHPGSASSTGTQVQGGGLIQGPAKGAAG